MSTPGEPSDAPKPVVKDKNPHNYRKVGYSMIVISVSLVLIGLLVWAIGDDYHFSSDIMGNQEIDAMTPKHGYNIVFYDTAQPVGAKLKLLDSASALNDAQQKQIQDAQQNPSTTGMVLIFNGTLSANKQLVLATINTITQAQAAQLKASQAKEAAQTITASANQTVSPPSNKNVTSSSTNTTTNVSNVATTNPIKISSSINVTKTTASVNATTVTHILNSTLSGKPAGANVESLAIGANVTLSHSSNNVTSSATNSTHTKTASLSEHVAVNSG